jgi:hypothetical protein
MRLRAFDLVSLARVRRTARSTWSAEPEPAGHCSKATFMQPRCVKVAFLQPLASTHLGGALLVAGGGVPALEIAEVGADGRGADVVVFGVVDAVAGEDV